jgi:ABC-2 type transport system ATP-binding protein
MENAERMCDSVCIIARGEKVLDGTVSGVKAGYGKRNVALSLMDGAQNGVGEILRDKRLVQRMDDNNRFFEIELAQNADPQELLQRLVGAGARIERFELITPSLHQIFLDRVGAANAGIETGMSGHG